MILKRALKLIKLYLKPTKKTNKLNSGLTHSTRTISEENHIPFEENTNGNDHPFGCNISDLVHLPGEVSRFLIHVSASETTENRSDFFLLFFLFLLKVSFLRRNSWRATSSHGYRNSQTLREGSRGQYCNEETLKAFVTPRPFWIIQRFVFPRLASHWRRAQACKIFVLVKRTKSLYLRFHLALMTFDEVFVLCFIRFLFLFHKGLFIISKASY